MQILNLPEIQAKIRLENGIHYIFDPVRKKYLVLTPEEWVRQHFIQLLINEYKYPRSLFAIETGLYYNKLAKRSDIMILGVDGIPFLLVECKAPSVKLGDAVFQQIARYNFAVKPRFMAVTNGLEHFCFGVDSSGRLIFFEDFPPFLYKE